MIVKTSEYTQWSPFGNRVLVLVLQRMNSILCHVLPLIVHLLNLREIRASSILMICPGCTRCFNELVALLLFMFCCLKLNLAPACVDPWLHVRVVITVHWLHALNLYLPIPTLMEPWSLFGRTIIVWLYECGWTGIVYLGDVFMERSECCEYGLLVLHPVLPPLQDAVQQILIQFCKLLSWEASYLPFNFSEHLQPYIRVSMVQQLHRLDIILSNIALVRLRVIRNDVSPMELQ